MGTGDDSVSAGIELNGNLVRTASYYDHTAGVYDAQVDGHGENRAIRAAFRTRVSMLAGPGRPILDFGCGTGTDAAWYAEHGHPVVAYDISSAMLEVLRARCAAGIADGVISPVLAGDFHDLETALRRVAPLGAIAANFAVLNHIDDLGPLLESVASHLTPGASLVASMLNPWYRGNMGQWWWWRSLVGSLRTGAIVLHGEVTTYRHFARTVVRMLPPTLALVDTACSEGSDWKSLPRGNPLSTMSEEFIFFVLRRKSDPA